MQAQGCYGTEVLGPCSPKDVLAMAHFIYETTCDLGYIWDPRFNLRTSDIYLKDPVYPVLPQLSLSALVYSDGKVLLCGLLHPISC